jgi:hypothetical protein
VIHGPKTESGQSRTHWMLSVVMAKLLYARSDAQTRAVRVCVFLCVCKRSLFRLQFVSCYRFSRNGSKCSMRKRQHSRQRRRRRLRPNKLTTTTTTMTPSMSYRVQSLSHCARNRFSINSYNDDIFLLFLFGVVFMCLCSI